MAEITSRRTRQRHYDRFTMLNGKITGFMLSATLASALVATACHHDKPAEGPFERAGQGLDTAADKTGTAVKGAAEKTGTAVKGAAEKTGDALGRAGKATGRAFEHAGQKLTSKGPSDSAAPADTASPRETKPAPELRPSDP